MPHIMRKILLLSFLTVFSCWHAAMAADGPPGSPPFFDGTGFYESERLSVSALYPNPAIVTAKIDYRIYDDKARAVLVLRNVLGSEIGKYKLSPEGNRLTINLDGYKAGVYFYTLVIDEKSVSTRKFVISK